MSQVIVKWVEMDVLLDADEKQCYAPSRQDRMIPVVPLSALREVVEILQEVVKKNYAVWKAHAEFADDPTDHNTLHADLMKHDPIYAKAQRLLASLGEQ